GDIMENYEIHRDLLHLPEYVFPALMLVFGYPTAQQLERRKPERAPLDFIVHENGYRTLSREDMEKGMGISRGNGSFDDWMQAFCKRKYHSDFSLEMTRSVEEALKNFRHQ
ncbi:MAG: nitroreductase, partial [Coprococcus sp.]